MAKTATNNGKIVQVIGAVVDVDFSTAELPEINNALEVDYELYGSQTTLVLEVLAFTGWAEDGQFRLRSPVSGCLGMMQLTLRINRLLSKVTNE